jgi:hypothetical protein
MQAIGAVRLTRIRGWPKLVAGQGILSCGGPAMANSRVLVAAHIREYVCVGPHDAARHAPHQVPIEGLQGQCSRCELEVEVWDEVPDL